MNTDYDWPGWPLESNPYGKDFDLQARTRMIQGSGQLLPLLEKYDLGGRILEVGPFFNPLVTPERFPQTRITYFDNDHFVCDYLSKKYQGSPVTVVPMDLNHLPSQPTELYSAIVGSHILNYIDYQSFIHQITSYLEPNGLLLMNNSVDCGIPAFFSPKRPRHNLEILSALQEVGLILLDSSVLPTPHPEHQPNDRLLLVAQLHLNR